jgi:predicted small lipoprotein YifL
MKLRLALAITVALCFTGTLAGCGVKDDLEKPNAKPMKKGEQDPSKPPSPLGQ